ncbi:MAG: hypothetical protein NTX56_10060 [Proteobacteria bacterium]|nr:hypothetical protein [Pseudomonadota bacterium]
MKTRSICLAPGRLEPGMTTAAAIHTRQGEELLPTNCVLDESMIERIRRRLIKCVMVTVIDERDAATVALDVETEEKRLSYIFRGESSEARSDLHAAVRLFRQRQAQ